MRPIPIYENIMPEVMLRFVPSRDKGSKHKKNNEINKKVKSIKRKKCGERMQNMNQLVFDTKDFFNIWLYVF